MSNMEGRIARAIEAVLRHPPILSLNIDGRVSSDWIAHEVLRAMREPTSEMVAAAAFAANSPEVSAAAPDVWRSMIDAALKG